MPDRDPTRRSPALYLTALIPAVLLALAVALQAHKLSVPATPHSCPTGSAGLSRCVAKPIAQAADSRSGALKIGWLAVGLSVLATLGLAVLSRPQHRGSEHERAVLLRACAQLRSEVKSEAIREQLGDAIEEGAGPSRRIRNPGGSGALALLTAAALPLIAAVVVAAQGQRLAVPRVPRPCASPGCVAKPLARFSEDRRSALAYGLIGVVVLVGVGAASGRLLARARSPLEDADGATERQALVSALVHVCDLLADERQRKAATRALAVVGVERVEVPVGERFDAARHRAVGSVPTTDGARDHLVAATERPGYVDHGRRLRYPEVLVFTMNGGVEG